MEWDKDVINGFMETVGQFERIVNDCGFVKLIRLTDDEITGTKENPGLVEKIIVSYSLIYTVLLFDNILEKYGYTS